MATDLTRREIVFIGLTSTLTLLPGCDIWKIGGLNLRQHPDPLLRKTALPIERITASVIDLGNSMAELLKRKSTIDFFSRGDLHRGLAAPQVGELQRIIVCALRSKVVVMVNPEITDRDGTYISRERCMSLKGHEEIEVRRSASLQVGYTGLDERMETLTLKGRDAALVEHEVDHLNGILYIDYS